MRTREFRLVLLGMAIQATHSALGMSFGWFRVSADQQAMAAVLFITLVFVAYIIEKKGARWT